MLSVTFPDLAKWAPNASPARHRTCQHRWSEFNVAEVISALLCVADMAVEYDACSLTRKDVKVVGLAAHNGVAICKAKSFCPSIEEGC